MPFRNSRDSRRAANTTFHVYNRGLNRRAIFLDDHDRREFLQCLRRHLGPAPQCDGRGREYLWLTPSIEVIACCLMPNHFHLVVHQRTPGAMEALMHAALTGYGRYFNRRHGRAGQLFAGPYRATPKHTADDIKRAIIYVHLNHENDPHFQFSSHRWFVAPAAEHPIWLSVNTGLEVFGGRDSYLRHVERELQSRR